MYLYLLNPIYSIIIQLGFFESVLWYNVLRYIPRKAKWLLSSVNKHNIVFLYITCWKYVCAALPSRIWWLLCIDDGLSICDRAAYVQQHLPSYPESEYIKFSVYFLECAMWKNNQYTHNLAYSCVKQRTGLYNKNRCFYKEGRS